MRHDVVRYRRKRVAGIAAIAALAIAAPGGAAIAASGSGSSDGAGSSGSSTEAPALSPVQENNQGESPRDGRDCPKDREGGSSGRLRLRLRSGSSGQSDTTEGVQL